MSPFRLELTWLRDKEGPYELGDNESHLCMRVAGDYDAVRAEHLQHGLASATRTTTWGSISSTIPTTTGSKYFPSDECGRSDATGGGAGRGGAARRRGDPLSHRHTVWGLGCDATNAEAVAKIYELKRSADKKSMLVLCASADMVVRYVNRAPGIAFEVMELATEPLTLILPGAAGGPRTSCPRRARWACGCPTMRFAAACCGRSDGPWYRRR